MFEGKVWISIVTLHAHATHFVDGVSVPTDEWQKFATYSCCTAWLPNPSGEIVKV